MKEPKVVVITLNYNQSKMTLDCVESILRSDFENFKLLVIDNGSNREEYQYLSENLSKLPVEVERIEKNCGYVGGINKGFKKALRNKPDYFLIMNNDTIIDSEAIKYLVEAGEKYGRKAIVTGKVFHFDRPNTIQTTGSFFLDRKYLKEVYPFKDELDKGQCEKEDEREMIDDIFWLVPKNIFDEVGYYSDNFFIYCEQGDYALRAVRRGFKLIYTPKAKIWHKGSVTTGGGDFYSPPVNFWRHKGGLIYLYRNTKKKYFYYIIFKTFPILFAKYILNILNMRKNVKAKSDFAALLGYVYGIKWIFNKRPDTGYNPFLK